MTSSVGELRKPLLRGCDTICNWKPRVIGKRAFEEIRWSGSVGSAEDIFLYVFEMCDPASMLVSWVASRPMSCSSALPAIVGEWRIVRKNDLLAEHELAVHSCTGNPGFD